MGARAGKYKFGARAGKHKVGDGQKKKNWEPGPVNTNWGPGSGPGAKQRAGGREIQTPFFIRFRKVLEKIPTVKNKTVR